MHKILEPLSEYRISLPRITPSYFLYFEAEETVSRVRRLGCILADRLLYTHGSHEFISRSINAEIRHL